MTMNYQIKYTKEFKKSIKKLTKQGKNIDKLLNIVESKYELVHIAARRSKEIAETGYLQMPENEYKCKKNIGRALEEIEAGLLKIKENN